MSVLHSNKENFEQLVLKSEMELAAMFGIVSIPTPGGQAKVAATAVGYRPKEDILKILE